MYLTDVLFLNWVLPDGCKCIKPLGSRPRQPLLLGCQLCILTGLTGVPNIAFVATILYLTWRSLAVKSIANAYPIIHPSICYFMRMYSSLLPPTYSSALDAEMFLPSLPTITANSTSKQQTLASSKHGACSLLLAFVMNFASLWQLDITAILQIRTGRL